MFNPALTAAVEQLAALFVNLPDTDLERPWQWKGHDEGLRFAFFVTNLELRQLAVKLAGSRTPPQPVHRILGQYHAAYLDLQAALAGVAPADADRAPSEQDWPIRKVYAHILGADLGFTAMVRYALELHRAGKWTMEPASDEALLRQIGLSEKEYDDLLRGPYTTLLAYHRDLHSRIIPDFSSITAEELDKPAAFWEPEPFPIRYRLHRYEAHFRQHTIQVDKTLAAIGLALTESKRLIRMLYNALAEVDSALIGAEENTQAGATALAQDIAARTEELSGSLKKPAV